MTLRLLTSCSCTFLGWGLRTAAPVPQDGGPELPRLLPVAPPELVPSPLVSAQVDLKSFSISLDECLSTCHREPNCFGILFGAEGRARCCLRGPLPNEPDKMKDQSCLERLRGPLWAGFAEVPLVALAQSDGTVYLREDCQGARVQGNTYCGVPWQWRQPGLALSTERGYGMSPLLNLVTTPVLKDMIVRQAAPWSRTKEKAAIRIDVKCKASTDVRETIGRLSSPMAPKGGRALIADIGACICRMLSSGWDPAKELQNDVVLLLHEDHNFSPAPPYTEVERSAKTRTSNPCYSKGGANSVFTSDVEAFTALADSPRVLGMYFVQTPPISHEKVWLVPLGAASKGSLYRYLVPHLGVDSPQRMRNRTALYNVGHSLAVAYRRTVFQVVQENFGGQLRLRYLPDAFGSRMHEIMLESFEAVFGQSPPGIGENCYRHYELLLAGTIPVVQASLGIAAMRYFPHLAVSNWREVTPELLRQSYEKIWDRVRRGEFSYEPMTVEFWRMHINNTAHRNPQPAFYAKFPNPKVTCHDWNCTKPLEC